MADYSQWTKEQLISKLRSLETASGGGGGGTAATPNELNRPQKKQKEIDFSKFTTRKIALRFSYLGWNYNGLAVQTNADPDQVKTVEHEILAAAHKTRLIQSMDVNDCDFSRCGRTDRGVSALRQVISLRVRSILSKDDQLDSTKDDKELDYLHILNNLLPKDIRIFEICLRPGEEFDARFSCLNRHYKYFFTNDGLDIGNMDRAAQMFLGEHDFRNFCKIDAAKQITNFTRRILSSSIKHHSNNLYYFDLKGTAFLWHQVRSMVAILFHVGQGLEQPDIITKMLDMQLTPQRPVYEMASDIPLVLYDCEFPNNIEWKSFKNAETRQRVLDPAYNLWYDCFIRTSMANEMLSMITANSSAENPVKNDNRYFLNTGVGKGRPQTKYVSLEKREKLDTPEVVNQRYLDKKAKK